MASEIEIRTGSDSDIPKIAGAYRLLDSLGISYSPRILSAHRTSRVMMRGLILRILL